MSRGRIEEDQQEGGGVGNGEGGARWSKGGVEGELLGSRSFIVCCTHGPRQRRPSRPDLLVPKALSTPVLFPFLEYGGHIKKSPRPRMRL